MAQLNKKDNKIKDALNLVSEFDGKNISIFEFIQDCEVARESLPPEYEMILVKFLRIKLKGKARECIFGLRFQNCQDFYAYLKKSYAPRKSLNRLEGDLSNFYQENDETIFTYATRIRKMGYFCKEVYKTEEGDVIANYENIINRKMTEAFLDGLLREIRHEMKGPKPVDFEDAVEKALIAESKLENDEQLRGNEDAKSENDNDDSENIENDEEKSTDIQENVLRVYDEENNFENFEITVCQLCSSLDHTTLECKSVDEFLSVGEDENLHLM